MVHFEVRPGLGVEPNTSALPTRFSSWPRWPSSGAFASISGALQGRTKRGPVLEVAVEIERESPPEEDTDDEWEVSPLNCWSSDEDEFRQELGTPLEDWEEDRLEQFLDERGFPPLPRVVFDPESMEEVVGERFFIFPIKADGRCLFRALAQSLSRHKGDQISWEGKDETARADGLRLAVRDALCRTEERRKNFKEALFSLERGEQTDLTGYCKRLESDKFGGGEVEMLVLSKMLHTPIYVWQATSDKRGKWATDSLLLAERKEALEGKRDYGAYKPIAKYGKEYEYDGQAVGLDKSLKKRRPTHLLFYGKNRYHLLGDNYLYFARLVNEQMGSPMEDRFPEATSSDNDERG